MSRLCQFFGLSLTSIAALAVGVCGRAPAGDAIAPTPAPLLTMESLLRMDRCGLEQIYRSATPGQLPLGAFAGRATPHPGTQKGVREEKRIAHVWKGKEFDGNGIMINRLALGAKAIKAEMFMSTSYLDGQPAIVLDYAHTSRLAREVRDEMREVSPGLYLGLTYVRQCPAPKLEVYFCIQALPDCASVLAKSCR